LTKDVSTSFRLFSVALKLSTEEKVTVLNEVDRGHCVQRDVGDEKPRISTLVSSTDTKT